ncbi:Omp28-related outer membrane protein [bacterium]|nr:Omp28-related outer membrane protein [bacterium]
MCEDQLLPNEFNYIQYEASSGGLSCPESDDRHSYYADNGTGIPDTRFDGSWQDLVGAPESYATGEYFLDLIDQRRQTTSPIAVIVSDFSYEEPGAFAEVTIKAFGDIDPANHYIRVAVVEDGLNYGGSIYDNVCRDMYPSSTGTPLTVSTAGDEQIINVDMAIQAGWNPNNLQIIAFVQNDGNKEVIQSGNSFVGEYAAVAGVSGPQQVIADGGQVVFDPTNLINIGLNTDTFDVSIDTSNLPEGWDANLSYEGSDYQTFSVTLDAYDSASFNVVMDTGTVGSGRVVVDIYSQGAGEIVESLDFVGLAGGTDFLLVADDGNEAAYDVYAPALDATGKSYAIWDRGLAAVAGEDLMDYDAVIWETGLNGDVLGGDDRDALDMYLDGPGRLILAGDDLLESLYSQGGSARLWYQLKLRLNYGGATSNSLDVVGLAGDPIGDGISFTLTGGDPDQPALISGQPVEVSCEYGDGDPAVVRTTYNDYQVVLFPFGMENVPLQSDVNTLMYGALQWLGALETTDAGLPEARLSLAQNAPNPFNPATKIAFNLDRAGQARLEIFNARGQLVRVLADEALPAGAHEFTWQGRTDTGQQAASGTYFYRLVTGDETLTRKMTLVK